MWVENIVRKGEIACYKQFLLFSHNVFHSYISLVRQNETLSGNWLTTSKTSPGFYVSAKHFFLNAMGKWEITHNEGKGLF